MEFDQHRQRRGDGHERDFKKPNEIKQNKPKRGVQIKGCVFAGAEAARQSVSMVSIFSGALGSVGT